MTVIGMCRAGRSENEKAKGRKMSSRSIGIDLGTTYSAMAFLDANGKPETIRSEEGELTTPSVVFFDMSGPIVGREAVKAAEFDASRVARYAKRCIGEELFPKTILDNRLPPEVIESLVLKKLKSDGELKLGSISKAVITVPAYFNETRRKATQDAGRLAGIEVLDIINEPTAAAIAYGVQSGFLDGLGNALESETVLVYDLGGGTFDATLMEIDGRNFDAIATAGDVYLGGVDWDKRLVDYLAEQFEKEQGIDLRDNPSAMERLIQESESAKKTLTARDETQVRLGVDGKNLQLTLSRSQFEQLTEDLLERTRMTCERLLSDAGKAWADITRLILVGGSTRMPMVHRMLEEESSLVVDRSLAPDEAVAHGAAIYAGILSGFPENVAGVSVANINSHDLGVLGLDPKTKTPKRQVMIPRNTKIPATRSKTFSTSKPGQKDVLVAVVEGGTDSGEHALKIGKCVITNLPTDLPKGSTVKVTFKYENDGRLSVSAELPDVECAARTIIERFAGLNEQEICKWKERLGAGLVLEKLKDEPVAVPSEMHESDLSLESELDELLDEIAASSEKEGSAQSDSDAISSATKQDLQTVAPKDGNQQEADSIDGEKKSDTVGGAKELASLETEATNDPSSETKKSDAPGTDVQEIDSQDTGVPKDELPFAADELPKVASDDPALQAFLKGLK